MSEFNILGKILLFFGVVLIILEGIFLLVGNKLPFSGRFPGDIVIQRKNFVFYFPYRIMYFSKYYSNYHFPNI